ncbi:flagellar protein FlaG [Opacimonas viscosa]|uniref:Flagellar protein FlaG n=1 Tax=Opacimonas viscosa TaxID=2961944 RepID=A0AA41X3A8_9ALTE|nr:flagellar protein FlaG [Opacimonas viscosa]MCP3427814.1 flagellar protein FlaG [Opacimonas viscosa]
MEINSTTSGQILANSLNEKGTVQPTYPEVTVNLGEQEKIRMQNDVTLETNLVELEAAVATLEPVNRDLNFQIDKNSAKTIVSVVDSESGDVIRQIPSEEFIKIAEKIKDMAENSELRSGILFNSEV